MSFLAQGRDILKTYKKERNDRFGHKVIRTALDDLPTPTGRGREKAHTTRVQEDIVSSSESVSLSDHEEEEQVIAPSMPLGPRTGNFDADIPPSPKVSKCKKGQKRKRSNTRDSITPDMFDSPKSSGLSSDIVIPPSGVPRRSAEEIDTSVGTSHSAASSGDLLSKNSSDNIIVYQLGS